MPGRNGRGVNAQVLVVGRSPDHFLTPVAENVRTQARRGLAAVVRRTVFSSEERSQFPFLPVPFGDTVAVEQFAQKIAVPPDREVRRTRGRAKPFPLAGPQSGRAAPHFFPQVTRIDIGRKATAHIRTGTIAPQDLSSSRVKDGGAGCLK